MVILYRQGYTVSPRLYCIAKVILYRQGYTVSPRLYCIAKVILYRQGYTVSPRLYCIAMVILYRQGYTVSPRLFCIAMVIWSKYRQASVKGRAHTLFIDVSDIDTLTWHIWALPIIEWKLSDTDLQMQCFLNKQQNNIRFLSGTVTCTLYIWIVVWSHCNEILDAPDLWLLVIYIILYTIFDWRW